MSAPPPSQKDGQQVLKYAFDDVSGKLRVDAVISPDGHDLEIHHEDDSIAIGTPTDLFTSTTIGPDIGLDVNVINSIPLPAGASTEAKQDVGNSSLASIDSKLTSPITVTGPLTDAELRASPVPVTGTVTTSPNVNIHDSAGASLTSTASALDVNIKSTGVTQGTSPWVISGTVTADAGTNLNTSLLALDSTVAKDASLTTINTSINTLLKPANTLTAVTTVGTITNVVHVDDNGGSLTVDNNGTFPVQATLSAETTKVIGTVNQGTSPWVTSGTSTVSGTVSVNSATTLTTNTVSSATDVIVPTDVSIYGEVSIQLIFTGSATVTFRSSNDGTNFVDTAFGYVNGGGTPTTVQLSNSISYRPVDFKYIRAVVTSYSSGSITATLLGHSFGSTSDPGLRVTGRTWNLTSGNDSVSAVQSGTWNINNISGTISLPTGASTSALQTTGNTSLSSIDSKTPALGQAVMTSSSPVVIASNQTAIPISISDQTKATYSASTTFTVAATATDIFTITGSATKTIKIRYVDFSGVNTANTNVLVTFLKRSTANSGGTSSTITSVPHNSSDSAATATVRSYTVNPTLGSLVGNISNDYIFLPTLASTNPAIHSNFTVADTETKPITLNGTSEVFCINLNSALITGTTTISADITWTEE